MERSTNSSQNTKSYDKQMVKKKFLTILKWGGLVFAILFLLLVVYGSWLGFKLSKHLRPLQQEAKLTATSLIKDRDLSSAQLHLTLAKKHFTQAKKTFAYAKPFQYLPVLSWYWHDVDHLFRAGDHGFSATDVLLANLTPYADILGLKGHQTTNQFNSAEEKIIFVANTTQKLAPALDKISTDINQLTQEIQSINPAHYPQSLFHKPLRPLIIQAQKSANSLSSSLTSIRPFLTLLPDLLGNPQPRTYLLLFQNDGELRPTGGFLTAYATLKVYQGKIEAGVSQDIYTLDSQFTQKIPAPPPIKKYLPLVYYWNLRDMNLSPDFKISMDTFTKYYLTVPNAPKVDGIIAIDTQVPVNILKILGPVGVPGYPGKFSAQPEKKYGIPQVIYTLENIITRPTYEIRKGRKSILGPLMHSLLANMLNSPKSQWPRFFDLFITSIRQKHLLMYFFDPQKQKAVEALQAAGRIVSYSQGDYLHINDTNFAGAKSNLFINYEVEQDITPHQDGSLTKKLTLIYRNPAPPSNCNLEAGQLCLNGVFRDWVRIYVPKGSKLVSMKGFEVKEQPSQDLDKTVFAGFFTMPPQSIKKLEVTYQTPPLVKNNQLHLLIQKQPGKKTIKHLIKINNNPTQEFSLSEDKELILSL